MSEERTATRRGSITEEANKIPVAGRTGLPVGTKIRILKSRNKNAVRALGLLYPPDDPYTQLAKVRIMKASPRGTCNAKKRAYPQRTLRFVVLTDKDVWDVVSNPLDLHEEATDGTGEL